MLRLGKQDLLREVIDAISASGWSVSYYEVPPRHPFRLHIYRGNETVDVLLYIWNITHGGRGRSTTEYRVQITGVTSIGQIPGLKTVVLGYWADNTVFAGWDARRHSGPVSS